MLSHRQHSERVHGSEEKRKGYEGERAPAEQKYMLLSLIAEHVRHARARLPSVNIASGLCSGSTPTKNKLQ